MPGLIDEIPVLAVAAACADGVTEFRDAGELAVKETDRIATVTAALRALGVGAEGRPDGLIVGRRWRARGRQSSTPPATTASPWRGPSAPSPPAARAG